MDETKSHPDIRDLLTQFKNELNDYLKRLETKFLPPLIYPQIVNPDSGDNIPANSTQIHIDVRSNQSLSLVAQLYTTQGTPVGNSCIIHLTQNGNKYIGHADMNKPGAGQYVIYCYVQGDNPMNPTHHVAKVFINVLP
ncbi:MAG: hypothetical protein RMJ56_17065 [Gemmataceae bacterium]|nr:hypothetical protein [Gemmata sp.]MDW8199308.1 hypothetical protein [Gemmataceae bacterium]